VLDWHNPKQGFLIMGRAENAFDVIKNARVFLAPLRFGAGLKGKLTDAMISGTPSITTPVGAEGMQGDLHWPGFVTDNDDEFVNQAYSLYTSSEKWLLAHHQGFEIINQIFSKQKHQDFFIEKLHAVFNNLNSHRQQNFIGSMLQHHTALSSKYLSKWIEEKNKNLPIQPS
jgi:glycosyltransferase involved in cell wall biosynthesis